MQALLDAIRNREPVSGMRFDGEELQEADLCEAEFRACRFSNCRFDEAILRRVKFVGCIFEHCSFRDSVIEDCIFSEGETGTQWRYCDLSKAEIRRSNLSLNTMIGSTAYLTAFADCALSGAKLDLDTQRKIRTQVIAGGVQFMKCKLQYAVFAAADFQESVFESSDLRDCSLSGSNLRHASFRGSSLHNIDLAGATLDHADLSHASFDDFDLTSLASFRATIVTRDQHEALLASLGLVTAD
ncbi:pentapeptide repeat-containing protein [Rhizobium straminoryzae]|uniref:Pentapeptide repeat-containing protein n=1 Tax=Rhizobium straminoryzae TaxID=1387186 RepID=A0A549TBQ6_9HYPH|nr:pentapeptide repeat-containing protein [Rhizobium straminoryzae]TRL39312.1 pentapeptide repeat-containing protein [Rhizobium straminoryzae]